MIGQKYFDTYLTNQIFQDFSKHTATNINFNYRQSASIILHLHYIHLLHTSRFTARLLKFVVAAQLLHLGALIKTSFNKWRHWLSMYLKAIEITHLLSRSLMGNQLIFGNYF